MTMNPRRAVISGASSGIGATLARRLADEGWDVLNLSLDGSPSDHAAIRDLFVDLSDPAALAAVLPEVAAWRADAFIHAAGSIRPALLPAVSSADIDILSRLHIGAAVAIAQTILPALAASACPRIVLIGTRAAQGMASRSAYAATKAGLVGLMRTWALELAPKRITVNMVSPGPIETPMFHALVPEASPEKATLAKTIPLGRIGTPDDVAGAVQFFLSSQAAFITGQNLFVCGGTSLGGLSL